MRHLLSVGSAIDRLAQCILRSKNGKRGLVNEILSIQIISAAVIGALAIMGLYWGGQWVLQDSYSRWALQWTDELNELGAPLYLSDDGEALIRLESFVDKYPEISQVAYYDRDGWAAFSVNTAAQAAENEAIPDNILREAKALVGSDKPYLLSSSIVDPRKFEILAPVWTESFEEDGLFSFNPEQTERSSKTELIGFVAIQLDFLIFHDRLLANIKAAVIFLLALLVLFALAGRGALRKALSSISDLHEPIQELARGNLDVQFQPAAHREISDIVEALETTATALSERDAKLIELANHDSLTGLFNRRRFVDDLKAELTKVVGNDRVSALFFIDLDQFKYINDSCGHPAGDRLICRVGDELTRCVGDAETVARFGGDEFVILQPNTNEDCARELANTVLANMRRLAHFEDERVFHVHCSIGITMIDGTNINHDDLLAEADIACREAKLAGRNRLAFFDPDEAGNLRASVDAGWMNRLRKAVDLDEFELRFQPINRIDTGETAHYEVLIRLRDDDGRLIGPDAFLPAAIRFGLMAEIDLWMIRNSAKAYAKYVKEQPDLTLSINLSANAFETEDLVSLVESNFILNGVDPTAIIFEITESLAIRRPRHVEKQFQALRALGCELALDDFGTGYSSFGHLHRLQFDYIKIDGAFVYDICNNTVDQKMIRLIAEIGHEAKMRTIAEYVQDADSLILLGDLGVDLAQGYFVGRPAKTPEKRSTPISLDYQRARRSQKHQ